MKITEPVYQLKSLTTSILHLPQELEFEIDEYTNKYESYNDGFLKVSDVHNLWYAEYGNKNGKAVLVVHGGPGAGCGEFVLSLFDLEFYRVILLDQRGAGKSTPAASIEENTTWDLVEDLEKLKLHLKIDKWLLFGGSWGTTLSLLYAQSYPESCLGLILRGVFLGTKQEKQNLWYGMRETYPEYWDEMTSILPQDKIEDLPKAFLELTTNNDYATQIKASRAFMQYDLKAGAIFDQDISDELNDDQLILAITRIFSYYSVNNFFIRENQILENINRISHLPLIIVHGRHDNICKPISAYRLHKSWPGSKLYIVQDGAHSMSDPAIANALLLATKEII
jgi:proline iminopeptidase